MLQLPDSFVENYPAAKFTTMKTGGCCRYYCIPGTKQELLSAHQWCTEHEIPWTVIGNGSNTVVQDEGFAGAVFHVGKGLKEIRLEEQWIYAEAGVPLPRLALFLAEHGIPGFAFYAGIPGTVGGAVVMNAGCLGAETADVLHSVFVIDEQGRIREERADQLALGFRTSRFISGNSRNEVIVAAKFRRNAADEPSRVKENTKKAADIRKAKFPMSVATVGSTFKSPPEGPHPGRLIELAGLKGKCIGGAQISEVHGNWIINTGNATTEDVHQLMELMYEKVRKACHIEMEPEVIFI